MSGVEGLGTDRPAPPAARGLRGGCEGLPGSKLVHELTRLEPAEPSGSKDAGPTLPASHSQVPWPSWSRWRAPYPWLWHLAVRLSRELAVPIGSRRPVRLASFVPFLVYAADCRRHQRRERRCRNTLARHLFFLAKRGDALDAHRSRRQRPESSPAMPPDRRQGTEAASACCRLRSSHGQLRLHRGEISCGHPRSLQLTILRPVSRNARAVLQTVTGKTHRIWTAPHVSLVAGCGLRTAAFNPLLLPETPLATAACRSFFRPLRAPCSPPAGLARAPISSRRSPLLYIPRVWKTGSQPGTVLYPSLRRWEGGRPPPTSCSSLSRSSPRQSRALRHDWPAAFGFACSPGSPSTPPRVRSN